MRLRDPKEMFAPLLVPMVILLTALLTGCGRTMMETPLLYRDSPASAFVALAPELRGNRIQVLFVTDREPAPPDTPPNAQGSRFYGNGRSSSAVLGIADVMVGPGAGSWEETAAEPGGARQSARQVSPSSIEVVSATELVRFPATPYLFQTGEGGITPAPEVAAELEQATTAARQEIVRRLELTPKKEVYVFIHGVKSRFVDAIISAAELWHFLGREGVPIAYTWPAGASGLIFYMADRESGEFTVLHLKDFLRVLANIPEVEKIHLAAHSRGTDIATTALRELIIESRASGDDPRERYKIENLVLVAADLDLEVAKQRLVGEALGPAFGRITIYTNANDSALAAARSLFSSRQRVGALKPAALTPRQREIVERTANLDVIVYEGGGGGIFRHSYFQDPVASSDMLMLLRYGWRPGEGKRQGLEPVGANIWRVRLPESEQ